VEEGINKRATLNAPRFFAMRILSILFFLGLVACSKTPVETAEPIIVEEFYFEYPKIDSTDTNEYKVGVTMDGVPVLFVNGNIIEGAMVDDLRRVGTQRLVSRTWPYEKTCEYYLCYPPNYFQKQPPDCEFVREKMGKYRGVFFSNDPRWYNYSDTTYERTIRLWMVESETGCYFDSDLIPESYVTSDNDVPGYSFRGDSIFYKKILFPQAQYTNYSYYETFKGVRIE